MFLFAPAWQPYPPKKIFLLCHYAALPYRHFTCFSFSPFRRCLFNATSQLSPGCRVDRGADLRTA